MSDEITYNFAAERRLEIISCPFSGGQGKAGVELGPFHVLQAGLVRQLEELSWKVDHPGDLEFVKPADDPLDGKLKNPKYVSAAAELVADRVEAVHKSGRFPLTIGGDHSLGIGTLTGTLRQYPDACVLWIDAHADINTPETTDSGNIHGCPVSFVLGLAEPRPAAFAWVEPLLKANRLAYIGLRDVDPGERKILREHNIAAYSMHEVDKYGIGKVVEMALARVNPEGTRPIHLSFDIDAMDPEWAPATGTPVRGGLSWRESCYICEAVAETGNLAAMDLVECNPSLGDSPASVNKTITAACTLVRSAMGERLL
ncbi:uncharacterized protein V1510DRAFT_419472 [Dipodascopsis tothii]|uniref:uncharacterized protein n=1 Tax=Dipodascopsis tothii TaxID=44089 RepID=UPI0034CEC2ED